MQFDAKSFDPNYPIGFLLTIATLTIKETV